MVFSRYAVFSCVLCEKYSDCGCQNGEYEVPDFLSHSTLDLLRCMLQTDPKRRINIDQLLTHDWLTRDFNVPVEWDNNGRVCRKC